MRRSRQAVTDLSARPIMHVRRIPKDLDLDIAITYRDYRDLARTFDKIVPMGMFGHVGHKNYQVLTRPIHHCLREAGGFLLRTIGSNVTGEKFAPWIRKYTFPNGMLPSLAQISQAVEELFVMEEVHNLGPHYDRTLMALNESFQAAWPGLSQRSPETFNNRNAYA